MVGRPWAEAKELLGAAGENYITERTRPTRDFFKIDESQLYVVRQLKQASGIWQLTLAAKLQKEVS